jgi:Flp pilus assembly pilin Flp
MSPSTLPRQRIRRAMSRSESAVGRRSARGLRARTSGMRRLLSDDAGMSTVEYAIGCVAAAAFAAVLYAVISGDSVTTALTQIVQRALSPGF